MTNDALNAIRDAVQAAVGSMNVYIGDLPELDEACIAIRPTDGYPSTVYFGMPSTLEPLVELLIRNSDYALGTDANTKAMKALDGFTHEQSGIQMSKVVGSPGYLGRNTNGFGEWHFMVHISLVTDI